MANKDWKGNGNSIYKTLGASNHTDKEKLMIGMQQILLQQSGYLN